MRIGVGFFKKQAWSASDAEQAAPVARQRLESSKGVSAAGSLTVASQAKGQKKENLSNDCFAERVVLRAQYCDKISQFPFFSPLCPFVWLATVREPAATATSRPRFQMSLAPQKKMQGRELELSKKGASDVAGGFPSVPHPPKKKKKENQTHNSFPT